jgi:type IV secretion system protein VirD4
MNKNRFRSFTITMVLSFFLSLGVGVAVDLLIFEQGTEFSASVLLSGNTLIVAGVIFGLILVANIIHLSDPLTEDQKRAGVGKLKNGGEMSQYSDSRWVTAHELRSLSKFMYTNYRSLGHVKKDGIVIRSELHGHSLDINMYKPIHTLVIGTTGSGKTEGYINPSIQILSACASKPSLVISDPKGELYNKNARKLKEEGYDIKVFDLRNPYSSTRWNPMDNAYEAYHKALDLEGTVKVFKGINPKNTEYKPISNDYYSEWYGFQKRAYPTKEALDQDLKSKKAELIDYAEEELKELAITLCPITSKTDQSWERGAQEFLWGTMIAMLEDSADPELNMTREKFNFYNLTKIASYKDMDPDNPFGSLKNYFNGRDKTSKALALASTAINNAPNTTRSYMGIVESSLSCFQDGGMCFATSINEMDFDTFADKPTALIIKVPDEKEGRHKIATMCIMQMYKKLIERANQTSKLELPRNVYFLLDEFANLPKIEKFDSLITVGRSRRIFFSIVVQSYSQLDAKYGEDVAKTIRGNCNIQIYIGSDDQKTKEDFSKLCGDVSIELQQNTKSKQLDKIESISTQTSKNVVSRPLIYPDELGHIAKEQAIVKIFNEYPIRTTLSFSYKCPMFDMRPPEDHYVVAKSLNEEEVYYDITERNSKKLSNANDGDDSSNPFGNLKF